MDKQLIIAVIGGSNCSETDRSNAHSIGRLIAQRGSVVVCGGGSGVMEAACQGAVEAGGLTIGILPGSDASDANPYVKIPIATGMGVGRNIIIIRTACAIIAVGGQYGTLSEIAFARQLNKPVFCLNSWDEIPGLFPVSSPEEAVTQAFKSVMQ